ncbi:MAG TPA: DMT family transporter, partial [Gemmatimonadales bacterium]|nr:DMT family transporter [Gemmatimonadales bacterium]
GRAERRWLAVAGLGGGALVAAFEVSYQFAIAGTGVAGAAALLYTAPAMVALLARAFLGEPLTLIRATLAIAVGVGAALTVQGGPPGGGGGPGGPGLGLGIAGGLLAAASYAGTTVLARFAVPRLGGFRFLALEIMGGTLILGLVLPLAGQPLTLPPSAGSWVYVGMLAVGTVWLANVLFLGAVRRIEATPTAVTATIEPVVGALLAVVLLGQGLAWFGWLGLLLVVSGVLGGYWFEGDGRGRSDVPG